MRTMLFILLLLFSSASIVYAADVRYVSDQLIITLRSGPGNQYQIVKTLPTGTRLELTQKTSGDYTQVSTQDGTQGWVRTQYLMDHPAASQQLAAAQSKLQSLQQQNAQLKQSLSSATQAQDSLNAQVKKLTAQTSGQSKELSHLKQVAATPIQLDRENKNLKERNLALERNLQIATQENNSLKDQAEREWFMAGAGVLLAGILLGLLLPKIRWRRKGGWDF